MGTFPDAGRRVGHIMLDAVSTYAPEGDPANEARMDLAIRAIADVDPIRFTPRSDGSLEADASDITVPGIILVNYLVEKLTVAGEDRELIIAELREYLDS